MDDELTENKKESKINKEGDNMSSIKPYTGVMFDPVNPESERIDIAHLHQITASPFPVQPREGAISPYSEDTFKLSAFTISINTRSPERPSHAIRRQPSGE